MAMVKRTCVRIKSLKLAGLIQQAAMKINYIFQSQSKYPGSSEWSAHFEKQTSYEDTIKEHSLMNITSFQQIQLIVTSRRDRTVFGEVIQMYWPEGKNGLVARAREMKSKCLIVCCTNVMIETFFMDIRSETYHRKHTGNMCLVRLHRFVISRAALGWWIKSQMDEGVKSTNVHVFHANGI